MARPTKLTDALQQSIVARITSGNYSEVSAESLGIHRATYFRWMAKGRKQKRGGFRDFFDCIKKARASDQVENVARIKCAAKGGSLIEQKTITKPDGTSITTRKYSRPEWTAAAWLLERKYPNLWGLRNSKAMGKMAEELETLRRRIDAFTQQPAPAAKAQARLHTP